MAKKRGNNEGSITRRPDGRWMAQVTIGRDPATGKPRRATFYGTTRQEVADKLTKALRDKQQGTFVAPHKLTLGKWLGGAAPPLVLQLMPSGGGTHFLSVSRG